jgi:hypothetical protein
MNSAYRRLEAIWSDCSDRDSSALMKIIPLLEKHGIRLRQKDGSLKQITLSIPTTKENAFVVGLRYIKNDGTFTEDHFLCESKGFVLKGEEIVHHPKRKLEDELQEYRGTHKEIPNIGADQSTKAVTHVNTYTYFGDFRKNEKNS